MGVAILCVGMVLSVGDFCGFVGATDRKVQVKIKGKSGLFFFMFAFLDEEKRV